MFGKIVLAWKLGWNLVKLAEQTDTRISVRFSDAWWRQLRKNLELFFVSLYERRDQGVLKHLKSDDQILRGPLILLKSAHIEEVFDCCGDQYTMDAAVSKLKSKPVYPTH